MQKKYKHIAIISSIYLGIATISYITIKSIPGASPFKYIPTIISIIAVIHGQLIEYHKPREEGKPFVTPYDKWLLGLGLIFTLITAVNDDIAKNSSDRSENAKNKKIYKLTSENNDLEKQINFNTIKTSATTDKTKAIVDKTNTSTHEINQNSKIILLDQKVLRVLEEQNNKASHQIKNEQRHEYWQQKNDARISQITTKAQAQSIRIQNREIALHSEIMQANRSVKILNQTLYGLNRTLNPVQNVVITYLVGIPLGDPSPQMQAYRMQLEKALQEYYDSKSQKKDVFSSEQGGEYQSSTGEKFISKRLVISRGSALYPTDKTIGLGSLFNYPVEIGIWHKTSINQLPGGRTQTKTAQPDTELETSQFATPELWYYPSNGSLVLAYTAIQVNYSKISDKITSIPDLNGSWIAIKKDNFNHTTQSFEKAEQKDFQKNLILTRIAFAISNHEYIYDGQDLHYAKDASGNTITYLIFDGKKSDRHTQTMSPAWWNR